VTFYGRSPFNVTAGEDKGEFGGLGPQAANLASPKHHRLSKNESVTSVKFGSSSDPYGGGALCPWTSTGALPQTPI